jgi:pimeloyl-ACP methyl ester carboxylesterase
VGPQPAEEAPQRARLAVPADPEQPATAEVELVPGAGHYVQIERPDETTDAIRELIASPR